MPLTQPMHIHTMARVEADSDAVLVFDKLDNVGDVFESPPNCVSSGCHLEMGVQN
jgi:hypothetical protein